MKTHFDSYCINDIPEGCKRCVKGEKLVLFITGKCTRNCYYCSLSNKRKNTDTIIANEKECLTPQEAVEEARESNATGAGITGGDPLLVLPRTIEYAKALKNAFGSNFHIHIYLPTVLVNEENLKALLTCIDEIRIHPSFLQKPENEAQKAMGEDIEKLKIANKVFKKDVLGLEMPSFPDKKEQIIEFIKKAKEFISFVNLNELEISETNFDVFTNKYSFNEDTYTISSSIEAGKEILNACRTLGLKLHLCTAVTKIAHQYGNRLKKTNALPFAERDKEGMATYFAIYSTPSNLENIAKELNKFEKDIFVDKSKNRILLSEKIVQKILKLKKFKVSRVKEYPTSDRTEVELYPLN